jgi:cytochrome c oxidase subunit II
MQITRSIKLLATIFLGLFLAGCTGSLAPVSTNAVLITNLMKIVFGIAAVIFVIVETLILYSVFKFRHKGTGFLAKINLPKQIEGNKFLETAWTLAPSIILLIVFILTVIALQTLSKLPDPPSAAAPNAPINTSSVRVRVVGHQYWWYFEYPDLNIVTANEMHVPVNANVTVSVEAYDVIHSFWVPQMGGKMDAIPGHLNFTWFKPTREGVFVGQCAELCGTAHANMRMNLFVESPEKFQEWVKEQQAPLVDLSANPEAAQGEKDFMNMACVTCHTLQGTKAQGKIGPDLTHLATRGILSGGVLENTTGNMVLWLGNPPAIKPGTIMPNLHIPPAQNQVLSFFLEHLK